MSAANILRLSRVKKEQQPCRQVPVDKPEQKPLINQEPVPVVETEESNPEPDLYHADFFLNRELSWINFNHQVLQMARESRIPLLEHVKFLSIVSSNSDEFYMKRLGRLKQQMAAGVSRLTVDGRSPGEQFAHCRQKLMSLQQEKEKIYHEVVKELGKQGVHLLEYSALQESERVSPRGFYIRNILPLVTPLAIDLSHPFPFISNLSLN